MIFHYIHWPLPHSRGVDYIIQNMCTMGGNPGGGGYPRILPTLTTEEIIENNRII